MKLEQIRRAWDEAGRSDPFWSVLTSPGKRGNRWEISEFLETGVKEIAALMAYLESLQIEVPRNRALDFGCGPGRLTQALAALFREVHGVDISPSMIELAVQLNRWDDRCLYHVNDRDDLALFGGESFDLVYSTITLQHMQPAYARKYLREFFRILTREGTLIFQLPGRPTGRFRHVKRILPESAMNLYRRVRHGGHPAARVYGLPREEVDALCQGFGGRVVDVQADHAAGPGWESFRYCCRRAA